MLGRLASLTYVRFQPTSPLQVLIWSRKDLGVVGVGAGLADTGGGARDLMERELY